MINGLGYGELAKAQAIRKLKGKRNCLCARVQANARATLCLRPLYSSSFVNFLLAWRGHAARPVCLSYSVVHSRREPRIFCKSPSGCEYCGRKRQKFSRNDRTTRRKDTRKCMGVIILSTEARREAENIEMAEYTPVPSRRARLC